MCLPESSAQNQIWGQKSSWKKTSTSTSIRPLWQRYFEQELVLNELHAGDFIAIDEHRTITQTPTQTCLCTAVAKLHRQVEEDRGRTVANTKQGCLSVNRRYVCVRLCVLTRSYWTHTLAQWHPFRSWCSGPSGAVLNDANISNGIPIFSSREQKGPASRHSRRVK